MKKMNLIAGIVVLAALMIATTGCSSEAQRESAYFDDFARIMNLYNQKLGDVFQEGAKKNNQGLELYHQGEKKEAKKVFEELILILDEALKINKEARDAFGKLDPPKRLENLHQLTLESLDAWKKYMEKDRQFVKSYADLKPDEKLQKEALELESDFSKKDKEVQAEFAKVTK